MTYETPVVFHSQGNVLAGRIFRSAGRCDGCRDRKEVVRPDAVGEIDER
jgi:hypothetical protein